MQSSAARHTQASAGDRARERTMYLWIFLRSGRDRRAGGTAPLYTLARGLVIGANYRNRRVTPFSFSSDDD